MKASLWVGLFLVAAVLGAQDESNRELASSENSGSKTVENVGPAVAPAAEPDAAAMPQTPSGRPAFEHDGQSFVLAASSATKNAETDEYVLSGERIADWTQLLTVQRLTIAKPCGTDEFLAYFKRQVETDGAALEVLKQGKSTSVFAVRFPKSERNEEQVMICLAFVDPVKPSLLNVIQYAIKPMRAATPAVEMRVRSWRDKFLAQAEGLAKS